MKKVQTFVWLSKQSRVRDSGPLCFCMCWGSMNMLKTLNYDPLLLEKHFPTLLKITISLYLRDMFDLPKTTSRPLPTCPKLNK